ncbi:MAG: hypothetical protein NDI60_10015 [Elusimicrobiales bacterium]|nr:hypothetical protein [Elusimicrobiales bacterium]
MLKTYAKIFFWGTFFFFLGTLAANLNMLEGLDSILQELLTSLVFGAAMSAAMGTMHIRAARKAAGDKPEGDIYSPRQARQFRLGLPPDRVFHLLSHYFTEVARYKVTGSDPVAGSITARTPSVILRSMGSRVEAAVARDGEGSLVTLKAAPWLPPAVADFGENLRIVLAAEKHLRELDRR